MQPLVRNRLAEIFIQGFDRQEARVAIEVLAFIFGRSEGGEGEYLERLVEVLGQPEEQVRRAIELLGAAPAMINVLPAAAGGKGAAMGGIRAKVGVDPLLREDGESIRGRAERYLQALREERAEGGTPVETAYGRARGAFNRGLYFESHEILEQAWRPLPPGPLRLYLQGIIQVSVGLHHAGYGRVRGALKQLDKGIEKLSRVLRAYPDPAAIVFCNSVARARDGLADSRTSRGTAEGGGLLRLEGGLPATIRDASAWGALESPGRPC
jgi:hypothetical protein